MDRAFGFAGFFAEAGVAVAVAGDGPPAPPSGALAMLGIASNVSVDTGFACAFSKSDGVGATVALPFGTLGLNPSGFLAGADAIYYRL